MSGIDVYCVTCLVDDANGIPIPSGMAEFLENILHFKFALLQRLPSHICLQCYNILCETKRFFYQLKDVEHYLNQTTGAESKYVDKGTRKETVNRKPSKSSLNDPLSEDDEELQVLVTANTEYLQKDVYKCEKCFRVYETREGFTKHLKWHITHQTAAGKSMKEKKYECRVCGKSFRSPTEKRSHEIVHTNLRPFKCEVCEKTFRQVTGLRIHRSVHYGKRVECPHCKKRYATKHGLISHLHVHRNKAKVSKCDVCMQSFSMPEEMQNHKQTHDKRFICKKCDQMYSNEENLDAHISTAHNFGKEALKPHKLSANKHQKNLVDQSLLENDDNLFI